MLDHDNTNHVRIYGGPVNNAKIFDALLEYASICDSTAKVKRETPGRVFLALRVDGLNGILNFYENADGTISDAYAGFAVPLDDPLTRGDQLIFQFTEARQ